MAWLEKIKELIMKPQSDEELFREKRAVPRISCFLEAELILEGGRSVDGTIIALEMKGMGLITPVKFSKGQSFTARLLPSPEAKLEASFSPDPVRAEVVWCRPKKGFPLYYAGVKFASEAEAMKASWVMAVLSSHGVGGDSDAQRRKSLRVPTALPVKVYYLLKGHKTFLSGLAHDIGLGGIKVNLVKDPGEGKELRIQLGPYKKLPMLECRGRIKRSSYSQRREDFTLGIEFMDLDEEEKKLVGRYIMFLLRESSYSPFKLSLRMGQA
jgi:hypothetical protein